MERTEDDIANEIVELARELMLKRDETDLTINANFGEVLMTVDIKAERNEEDSEN